MARLLTVDAREKACPLPIIELARACRGAEVGDMLLLLATDPAAEGDVRAWCEATGNVLVQLESEGRLVRAFVQKAR